MKIQDSGMPEETIWSTFFSPEKILKQMQMSSKLKIIVDLGCGFGTFTIPVAQKNKGIVHAFDIDLDMILQLHSKFTSLKIKNIDLHLTDFIVNGTGLPDNSIDYVMLFNILHYDNPHLILTEVHRILKVGGKAGIIHWRSDIPTPRGPSLDIRPKPEQCRQWLTETEFEIRKEILLEPYHFGIVSRKQ